MRGNASIVAAAGTDVRGRMGPSYPIGQRRGLSSCFPYNFPMCPAAPPPDERRQARDLEAVGRLAAGLAHDFNNMMTIVAGYSELLLGQLDPESTPHKLVGEIRKAGERAAGLARQLLAFSRRQQSAFQTVDLNSLVTSLGPLLNQELGPDVELVLDLD